ncbi:hypothetical protein ACLOJK_037022 [Asimina triloba]
MHRRSTSYGAPSSPRAAVRPTAGEQPNDISVPSKRTATARSSDDRSRQSAALQITSSPAAMDSGVGDLAASDPIEYGSVLFKISCCKHKIQQLLLLSRRRRDQIGSTLLIIFLAANLRSGGLFFNGGGNHISSPSKQSRSAMASRSER